MRIGVVDRSARAVLRDCLGKCRVHLGGRNQVALRRA